MFPTAGAVPNHLDVVGIRDLLDSFVDEINWNGVNFATTALVLPPTLPEQGGADTD